MFDCKKCEDLPIPRHGAEESAPCRGDGGLGQCIRQVRPDCIANRLSVFPFLQLKDDTGLERGRS